MGLRFVIAVDFLNFEGSPPPKRFRAEDDALPPTSLGSISLSALPSGHGLSDAL